MNRPWMLAECTWPQVAATRFEVAVLPWGATEAHNRHLPYGTDTIECDHVAAESGRLAWEGGVRVLVLPSVPFGVNTGQREIPFCLNMNPSTQALVLSDLIVTLEAHGVRKLVILNGHGGNDFRQMIRELQPKTTLFLCTLNWYSCLSPIPYFGEPGDHADELETSVMLHIAPQFVRPLLEAGPGIARSFVVTGLRDGWAWAPRQWVQVTEDTGTGNPSEATVAKGVRFFAAVTDRIAGFLMELAEADPGAMYR